MPLIPYPDVPNVPGVPLLPTPPAGFSFLSSLANLTSLETQTTTQVDATPQWVITDSNGATLLTPDSVVDFEYRNEQKISHYPVEEGSFASYNKIATPFDARMTVSCNGRGSMTRDAFLGTILALQQALTLVTIVTPDATYRNCNLVHVDYRRESRQGISLILAQLWFQEVRTVSVSGPTTAHADGASAQSGGQLSPLIPSVAQASAVASVADMKAAIPAAAPQIVTAAAAGPSLVSAAYAVGGTASAIAGQLTTITSLAPLVAQVAKSAGASRLASLCSIPTQMTRIASAVQNVAGTAVGVAGAATNLRTLAGQIQGIAGLAVKAVQ